MKRINNIIIQRALLSGVIFGLISCSTMNLKQYPQASPILFQNTQPKNGISIVAQPLLDGMESKEYFGVDLIEKGILAINITIRNDNPSISYMVPADSVRITQINSVNIINDPESEDQQAGEVAGMAGAVLISPLLFAVAAQQLSDASIIEENFEANKLRTTTIDPGETVAGFSYFNWDMVKAIDTPHLCVKVINPVEDISFPYCLDFSVKGEQQDEN